MIDQKRDFSEVKIAGGKTAKVDHCDLRHVEGYNWRWMRGKGVAAYLEGQTILMHSLIAPYERVSFRDGNKLNCTRSNLVPWRDTSRTRKGHWGEGFSDVPARQKFVVQRKATVGGEQYRWRWEVRYGRRDKEEARGIARNKAEWVRSLTPEAFVELVRDTRRKKWTVGEVVRHWSAFDGRELTRREFHESGVVSNSESWMT